MFKTTIKTKTGAPLTFDKVQASILVTILNTRGNVVSRLDLASKLGDREVTQALNVLKAGITPKVTIHGLPLMVNLTPLGYEYAQLVLQEQARMKDQADKDAKEWLEQGYARQNVEA